MSVSIGLLGFGASGSLIYLKPDLLGSLPTASKGHQDRVASGEDRSGRGEDGHHLERGVATAALLFGAATLAAYLGANGLPLDLYLLGVEPIQWAYLLGYFALLTLPFLFAGAATGFALSMAPGRAGRLYFAGMVGSGAGAAASPLLLNALPPGQAVAALALALIASAALWAGLRRSQLLFPALAGAAVAGWLLLGAPETLSVRTSPYKALNQALLYPGARVVWRGQNAFSRVDLLESPGIRSAPGLSLSYQGRLPPEQAVATDGENLSPVPPLQPGRGDYARYLPSAAAYRLLAVSEVGTQGGGDEEAVGARNAEQRSRDPGVQAGARGSGTLRKGSRAPSVLVLEPGGGLEAIAALEHGAERVTAVAGNPTQVEAVRRAESSYLDAPRLRLVVGGARGFLAADDETFDLIVMPLAESFRVVTAGSFSVSENYLLTVESVVKQYERLSDGGFLVVSRWLQLPPSEELRAFLIVVEALERLGVEDPARSLAAFRSFQTATILAKRGDLQPEEIEELRAFAAEMKYDLIHLPGLQAGESNRFNVLAHDPYFESFALALSREGRGDLLRCYPFDVSPTADDRPFFFHFFKPTQLPELVQKLGRSWQPFGGSGYLVMFALLGFALVASTGLILGPLWLGARLRSRPDVEQGARPHTRLRTAVLTFFLGLGVGYLFLEIPLMQRMILFLDQPTYSFAVVLFALLLFSGLGSLAADRVRLPIRPVLAALVVAVFLYAVGLPGLLSLFLGQPLALRLLVVLLSLAPLGFLMGMPFPSGIALLARGDSRLVPWAWAINGCASVVSSILASMIALAAGFSAVLLLAGAAYGVSALAAGGLEERPLQEHASAGGRAGSS